MTSRQEAKLNMYNAVVTHCDSNAAIVASVPAFQTSVNSFKDVYNNILETAQLEAQVISGIAMDKTSLRKELAQQAADIAAAVYAFASAAVNNTLKEQVNFSVSDLLHQKDELLGSVCTNISNAANDNIAGLADYGITAGTLTDFNTLIGNYTLAVSAPRNAVAQRSSYSAGLKSLFKQGDDILKNQMDKIINQFKNTQPLFYDTYKNNRIIIDEGTSATQVDGVITQSGTETTLSAVSVQVVGQSYNTASNGSGKYKLKIPVPGAYSIQFSKSGFVSKTIDNVEITLGQSTSLDVQLDAV
jgi:hypothetical protein